MQDQVELIRRIERQYLRDHLSALHLQMVDGMVIHLLFRRGPLRQEDIAQWIVADKGAVARSLARLEAMGLVVRTVSDQCRREKQAALTPAGEQTASQIRQVLQNLGRIRYQGFSPEERAQYESFLIRICENVQQYKQGGMTIG